MVENLTVLTDVLLPVDLGLSMRTQFNVLIYPKRLQLENIYPKDNFFKTSESQPIS